MSMAVQSPSNANIDAIFAALKNTSFRNDANNSKSIDQNSLSANSVGTDSAETYNGAVTLDTNRVEKHVTLMNKLQEAIISTKSGAGEIVDADAARIQALNIKQQLSEQTLSIANQSSDTILSLFQ